jgi:uncharacterized membrane protein
LELAPTPTAGLHLYNAVDIEYTREFLDKYDVRYIIVGQLERAAYSPEGIAKFERLNSEYWQEVYRDGNTAIYEVIPSNEAHTLQ